MRITSVFAAVGLSLASLAACSQPSDTGSTDDAVTPEATTDAGAGVVNVFTARHYSSDEAINAAFTEATGIEVNLLEAPGDLLIERARADGVRSVADVIITVDAGRLHRAEQAGLFQDAPELEAALAGVPANLRAPSGAWFGMSTRVRAIAYAKDRVDGAAITDFLELADPAYEGRICVRSSGNVYNQSLLAALIVAEGEEAAESWAAGIQRNMARAPAGGDTDQIRAIAAGECDVAIVNHYYFARLARSSNEADQAVVEAVDLVIPSLAGQGAHMNVSGAGLAAFAPNRDNALTYLEFLVSETSQRAFAELTNEYPVIAGTTYDNTVLDGLGLGPVDPVNVNALGENAPTAQRVFDRVGWP